MAVSNVNGFQGTNCDTTVVSPEATVVSKLKIINFFIGKIAYFHLWDNYGEMLKRVNNIYHFILLF